MSTTAKTVEAAVNREYEWGFVTDIEADAIAPGLLTHGAKDTATSISNVHALGVPAGVEASIPPTSAE